MQENNWLTKKSIALPAAYRHASRKVSTREVFVKAFVDLNSFWAQPGLWEGRGTCERHCVFHFILAATWPPLLTETLVEVFAVFKLVWAQHGPFEDRGTSESLLVFLSFWGQHGPLSRT